MIIQNRSYATILMVRSTSGMCLQNGRLYNTNYFYGMNILDYNAIPVPNSDQVENPVIAFANYPNPFKSITTISYSIPKTGLVRLSIFNIRGQLIRDLFNGNAAKGQQITNWDGRDNNGCEVASGMYFCCIRTTETLRYHKIMRLK